MKKLSNLASFLKEFLQLLSYVVLVYAGSKILNSDTAEIKITRNKIKRLLEKKKRLEDEIQEEIIKDKINELVPEDKTKYYNDLISKL